MMEVDRVEVMVVGMEVVMGEVAEIECQNYF